MSLVIPKPCTRQANYQKNSRLGFRKILPDVSYSSYHKFEGGSEKFKHQSLVVLVNQSFIHVTEASEKGLKAIFAEDVSISRTRLLPHKQDLNKPLVLTIDREADVLDWDFYLENPPLKPATTIELEFEYGGCSKPIPVIDPWDE